MAMLSVFRNDIIDAEKHFRLAIKAEPLNPTYHIGLGTALYNRADGLKVWNNLWLLIRAKTRHWSRGRRI